MPPLAIAGHSTFISDPNIEAPAGTSGLTKTERRALGAVLGSSMLYFVGLFYYASVRPIDGDEFFYTTAARLVWEGKVPYKDFFFQQAPLLPYIYSWIWAIHPHSLVAMRLFSAACGGLEVLLLGLGLIFSRRFPPKVALAAFAAVLLNPYSVSWNVVVKTFAVANLLVMISTICLYMALRSQRLRWLFVSGISLGACVCARSLYGFLIPAILLVLLHHELRGPQRFGRKSGAFLCGALAGGLPMIFAVARDPEAFIFNNITYHHFDAGYMILNGNVIEGYQGAGHVALTYLVMIVIRLLFLHPYFTIQIALTLIGIRSFWRLRQQENILEGSAYTESDFLYVRLAFVMLAVYLGTVLIPFPPYDQHFVSPLVPLTIPFVAEGLRVTFQARQRRLLAAALVMPLLFVAETKIETNRGSGHPVWELSSYRAVAKVIEANSKPDEVVMSLWPGYVFESGRRYYPGLENHFEYRIMNKITPQERFHYHVIANDRIVHAITNRESNLLVVPQWMVEYFHALTPTEIAEFHQAIDTNYSLIAEIEGVAVYRRRTLPS